MHSTRCSILACPEPLDNVTAPGTAADHLGTNFSQFNSAAAQTGGVAGAAGVECLQKGAICNSAQKKGWFFCLQFTKPVGYEGESSSLGTCYVLVQDQNHMVSLRVHQGAGAQSQLWSVQYEAEGAPTDQKVRRDVPSGQGWHGWWS